MTTTTTYRLGLILVTGSALAWSTAGLFTRALPFDSMTLLAWRGVFGAVGLAGLGLALEGTRFWRGFTVFARRDGWPAWLFLACAVVGMICFIASLRSTSVAHVAVIYAAVPFVASALGWTFIGERPSRSAIGASIAALVGVAIMVGFGMDGALTGDLLAAGMNVTMAISMVLARRYHSIPFLPAAALSSLISSAICWPFGTPFAVPVAEMPLVIAFGIVNSAVGFGLFTLGAKFLPAIETALIGALDAPLSPLWVWLVFGEVPGDATMLGGIIVFGAVAIHVIIGASSKPPLTAEIAALTPEMLP